MPSNIPAQAVNLLGLDTLNSLVLAVEVFSSFDPKKISARVLTRIWQHSVQTGTLARALAQEEAFDKNAIDDAAMAGLLHDLGKLILMDNFPEAYTQVLTAVRETGSQVHMAEHDIFSVSHAEVGAYLLGLWGLPQSIVEAVAFHHLPSQCPLDQTAAMLSQIGLLTLPGQCLEKLYQGQTLSLQDEDNDFFKKGRLCDEKTAHWNPDL